jgi:serine/threonine-protein kinase
VLLGKYRVERVLGQGGMGVVVAARHVHLGELFAIKFLLPEALASADAMDRFVREARAAARLKGEHVAKVHDVGWLDSGAPYMVMEHLDGCDLKALVQSRGPLPAEQAAALALQVCDAIAEAHAAGIIHRDLKPANLFLVRRPNGTPCVKVLDFGISKQVTPDGVDLTKSGTILGSPLYMAPEQMVRTKGVDVRCDVWAMGVVLYELLTGKTPFAGETVTEVVARVLQEEPLPPSRLRAEVPLDLDRVVRRCLQKSPAHRFQSVEELAEALRPIAGIRVASESVLPSAGRTQPLDPTIRFNAPQACPSQPDLMLSPASLPTAGDPATGSAWSFTGVKSRLALGTSKTVMGAAAVLTGVAIGIICVWLVRRPASEVAQEIQTVAVDSAVNAAAAMQTTVAPGDSSSTNERSKQRIGAPEGSSGQARRADGTREPLESTIDATAGAPAVAPRDAGAPPSAPVRRTPSPAPVLSVTPIPKPTGKVAAPKPPLVSQGGDPVF